MLCPISLIQWTATQTDTAATLNTKLVHPCVQLGLHSKPSQEEESSEWLEFCALLFAGSQLGVIRLEGAPNRESFSPFWLRAYTPTLRSLMEYFTANRYRASTFFVMDASIKAINLTLWFRSIDPFFNFLVAFPPAHKKAVALSLLDFPEIAPWLVSVQDQLGVNDGQLVRLREICTNAHTASPYDLVETLKLLQDYHASYDTELEQTYLCILQLIEQELNTRSQGRELHIEYLNYKLEKTATPESTPPEEGGELSSKDKLLHKLALLKAKAKEHKG